MNDTVYVEAELVLEHNGYSRLEVCRWCHVDEATLDALLEHSASAMTSTCAEPFTEQDLLQLMRAARLYHELQIDHAGVAMVMQLLERIERLEAEVRYLRQGSDL